jgi:hypothetical protein
VRPFASVEAELSRRWILLLQLKAARFFSCSIVVSAAVLVRRPSNTNRNPTQAQNFELWLELPRGLRDPWDGARFGRTQTGIGRGKPSPRAAFDQSLKQIDTSSTRSGSA